MFSLSIGDRSVSIRISNGRSVMYIFACPLPVWPIMFHHIISRSQTRTCSSYARLISTALETSLTLILLWGTVAVAVLHFHPLALTEEQEILLEDVHLEQQPSSEPDPDLDLQISDMSSGAWDEEGVACLAKPGETDLLNDLESDGDGGSEKADKREVPPRTISVTSGECRSW